MAFFFLLGLINNNGYVMIVAGADNLATDFDHKKLMPLFQLSMIIFSSATRIINAAYLLKVQHRTRIMVATCLLVTAFVLIAVCCFYDKVSAMFWLSLVASVIVGI